MQLLLTFAGTAFMLAIVPGPGQAVMMRQVVDFGRRPALMSTAGTGFGLLCWSALSAAGMAAVLSTAPAILVGLRWVGAGILAYLGARTLMGVRFAGPAECLPTSRMPTAVQAFNTGLLTNLLNPKAALFAVVLMPQFQPAGSPSWGALLLLGGVWSLVTMAWYVLFTMVVARGRQFFTSTRARRRLGFGSGASLILLAGAVAVGL